MNYKALRGANDAARVKTQRPRLCSDLNSLSFSRTSANLCRRAAGEGMREPRREFPMKEV